MISNTTYNNSSPSYSDSKTIKNLTPEYAYRLQKDLGSSVFEGKAVKGSLLGICPCLDSELESYEIVLATDSSGYELFSNKGHCYTSVWRFIRLDGDGYLVEICDPSSKPRSEFTVFGLVLAVIPESKELFIVE